MRRIFGLYLELGSVGAVAEALDREGCRSRQGYRFGIGPLAHLLKNRFYLGEIVWRGVAYQGPHTPIIDPETFKAVQRGLQSAAIARKGRSANTAFTLVGRLHDDAGNRMSPSHARKQGSRYRYYVSQALIQHRKAEARSIARVSAPESEAAVASAFPALEAVLRVTLHRDHLAIEVRSPDEAGATRFITMPFAWQPQGRRKGIAHEPTQKPRLSTDAAEPILTMIAQALRWMNQLVDGSAASTREIASRENLGERTIRKLLPLACLSPGIIRAIADGSAPANLTITKLTAALPHDWASQEQRFLI